MTLSLLGAAMPAARAEAPVQQLHEGWSFRQARLTNWYPATVPEDYFERTEMFTSSIRKLLAADSEPINPALSSA